MAALEKADFEDFVEELKIEEQVDESYNDNVAEYRLAVEEQTANYAARRMWQENEDRKKKIVVAEKEEEERMVASVRATVELSGIVAESFDKQWARNAAVQQAEAEKSEKLRKNALVLRQKLEQNVDNHWANERRKSAARKSANRREEQYVAELRANGMSDMEVREQIQREQKAAEKLKVPNWYSQ